MVLDTGGLEWSDGLYAAGFNATDQTKIWAAVDTGWARLVLWKLAREVAR